MLRCRRPWSLRHHVKGRAPPPPPKPDRRRALDLVASCADRCTEALSHGFTVLMLVELVRAGLETATAERVVVGGKTVEIVGVRIKRQVGRASAR